MMLRVFESGGVMDRLGRGVGLQQAAILDHFQRKRVENVVRRFSRQILGNRAVDDLLSSGAEDVDLEKRVFRLESRRARASLRCASSSKIRLVLLFLRRG